MRLNRKVLYAILLFTVGFEAFILIVLFALSRLAGQTFSLWPVLWQSFLSDVLPIACIGVIAAWWVQRREGRWRKSHKD